MLRVIFILLPPGTEGHGALWAGSLGFQFQLEPLPAAQLGAGLTSGWDLHPNTEQHHLLEAAI